MRSYNLHITIQIHKMFVYDDAYNGAWLKGFACSCFCLSGAGGRYQMLAQGDVLDERNDNNRSTNDNLYKQTIMTIQPECISDGGDDGCLCR